VDETSLTTYSSLPAGSGNSDSVARTGYLLLARDNNVLDERISFAGRSLRCGRIKVIPIYEFLNPGSAQAHVCDMDAEAQDRIFLHG
jgi:hypothetical protein